VANARVASGAGLKERALLAIDRCRDVIAGHVRQLAQRAEQQAQHAARKVARDEALALADLEAQRRNEASALAAAEAAALREAEEKARNEKLAAEALALRQGRRSDRQANSALRDGNTATGCRSAARRRGRSCRRCRRCRRFSQVRCYSSI